MLWVCRCRMLCDFLRRVVVEQAFPLELKVPLAETQAAIKVSRIMMSKRKARCADADALLAELEKTAASKPAYLPRAADYTKIFLKDWQRLSHSGRYDMVRLKAAMILLSAMTHPWAPSG